MQCVTDGLGGQIRVLTSPRGVSSTRDTIGCQHDIPAGTDTGHHYVWKIFIGIVNNDTNEDFPNHSLSRNGDEKKKNNSIDNPGSSVVRSKTNSNHRI